MTRKRACRVCGCTKERACVVAGVACSWLSDDDDLCSACAAAGEHVVSMTHRYAAGKDPASVGTCSCGWRHSERLRFSGRPSLKAWRRMDKAVVAHWQAVVAEAAAS